MAGVKFMTGYRGADSNYVCMKFNVGMGPYLHILSVSVHGFLAAACTISQWIPYCNPPTPQGAYPRLTQRINNNSEVN